jgi:hypothetical protein
MVRFPRRRSNGTQVRLDAAKDWQERERAAAVGRLHALAAMTPDPVRGSATLPPVEGDTVRVMRNGKLYLELLVARTESGMHPGWYAIYGGVKREGGLWGSYWESRAVYGKLTATGSVRMLSDGERIGPGGVVTSE